MVVSAFHFKFAITDDYNVGLNFGDKCNNSDICRPNFYCIDGYCNCNVYFILSNDTKYCTKNYPGKGENCTKICNHVDLTCNQETQICECRDVLYTNDICDIPQNDVFVTASQIALSAALVMGIAALAMVIYRLCTKPTYPSARQRTEAAIISNSRNLNENGSYRSSLSSIQIRVLSRLRDRPPAYNGENPRVNSPSLNMHNDREAELENPPPYTIGPPQDLNLHQPPPYTEVILSPNSYVNQCYTETEQTRPNKIINNK